jgi:hypothetical protein
MRSTPPKKSATSAYLQSGQPCSIYPEANGNWDIHDLATRKTNSSQCCHHDWWAFTPPSHPCSARSGAVIFFFVTVPSRIPPSREYGALCCPDFPSYPARGKKERQNSLLLSFKINYLRYTMVAPYPYSLKEAS